MTQPSQPDECAYSILFDDGNVVGCTVEKEKLSFTSITSLEKATGAKVIALVPIGDRHWGPQ